MPPQLKDIPPQPKTPEEEEVFKNLWSIRPCYLYNEEYDDCTGIRARFHQYFIHGDSIDCNQWKRDFDNCVKFERNPHNTKSALELIESEKIRRTERLKAHYGNDVWAKRSKAPEDWAKPLPEKLQKEYENSYLELKAREMRGEVEPSKEDGRTMCVIM
ncbi:synaptic plasticity regulator PANTS [Ochlerotatus camptorhynchus]|uniref:synaptic plasticity regulator PANTS n=1 Tax=Ochlerotatus camptorhynchus TaxID=644619 RepID=UPI0031DA28EE